MAIPTLATVGGQLLPVGYPGQLAAIGDDPNVESCINENATAIGFGDAVCLGTTAALPGTNGSVRPPVSGGVVKGIALRALSEANTAVTAGTINYPQYHDVPVINKGYVYCLASENVTDGDAAICVVASAGIGGATGGAANGTTRLTIPGAIWKTTTASGAVGLVHIVTA